ncbi:sulfurtransferase TusA family protein [Tissierella sp. Yu-01]|uniref:sulfurtransferase TusA family protein n=1 Tax=Tissierella sp. Yu-01 TaxID=3035694 RepID=UPI00240D5FFD|nr:sulfurtransferase TusA family protein [Tissierella sp. Yu-01]WFA10391.1 sulfurtransferase TusA family protein [Tissierella sp. Yu-01]
MSKIIDARGRSCPEPVIMTKNALDTENEGIKVLVDTNVAVENITRFAEGKGYKVEVTENSDDYEINIIR